MTETSTQSESVAVLHVCNHNNKEDKAIAAAVISRLRISNNGELKET